MFYYYMHKYLIFFIILVFAFFIGFYVIYERKIKLKQKRIDEAIDDLASNNA